MLNLWVLGSVQGLPESGFRVQGLACISWDVGFQVEGMFLGGLGYKFFEFGNPA